jgi:hypothetical protein
MNIQDSIRTINNLAPVFDMSGVGGERPITDDELRLLSQAAKNLHGISGLKKLDYLTKAIPEVAANALTVHLGSMHESAERMIEARKGK